MSDQDSSEPLPISAIVSYDKFVDKIDSPDVEKRRTAVYWLGLIKDQRAVPVLMRRLREEPEADIRASAASGLGELGNAEALPALLEAAHDDDDEVRQQVMQALGKLDVRAAQAVLVEALSDGVEGVQLAALQALSQLHDPSLAVHVVPCLSSASTKLRRAALKALAAWGDIGPGLPQVMECARADNEGVRTEALNVLTEHPDPQLLPLLVESIRDSSARVRRLAARALGAYPQALALRALITALDDPVKAVRLAAVRSLGDLKDDRALTALNSCLDDPDFEMASAAAEALVAIGTVEAIRVATRWGLQLSREIDTDAEEQEPRLALSAESLSQRARGLIQRIYSAATETLPELQEKPAPVSTQVSAYYPEIIGGQGWHELLAYIFPQHLAAAADTDARQELAGRYAAYNRAVQPTTASVRYGVAVAAQPHLPGFQFRPLQATAEFEADAPTRFDFKMRATADVQPNRFHTGRITFSVAGVIIADLPISVYVGEQQQTVEVSQAVARPYSAIFCSYSRRDTAIVERVERVYQALGLEYMRDVHTLRSGELWQDALYQLIEKADIFQLFWSPAAATSDFVEREWRKALALARPHFIRPVYWHKPIHPVPAELCEINFAFQPDLAD